MQIVVSPFPKPQGHRGLLSLLFAELGKKQ